MGKLVKILGQYSKIQKEKNAYGLLDLLKEAFPDFIQQSGFSQYLANVVTTIIADTTTSSLWNCSLETILGGISKAWAAGFSLDPALREAYLIPYGGKAQFQIGYNGLCKIAQKQNLIATSIVIFEGDNWSGLKNISGKFVWTHEPAKNKNQYTDKPIGCLAMISNKQTGVLIHAVFLSVYEIEVLRKRNKSQSGERKQAWLTDYAAMMQAKTIKNALTRGLAVGSDIALDDKIFTLTDNPISPIETESVEYSDVTPFVLQINEYKKQFEEFSQIADLNEQFRLIKKLSGECWDFLIQHNRAGTATTEPTAFEEGKSFYNNQIKPLFKSLDSQFNPAQ